MAAALGAPEAEAQPASVADHETPPDHEDEPERTPLPVRLSERPLTLPKGKVAVVSALGLELYRHSLDDECVMTLSGVVCFDESWSRNLAQSWAGVSVGALDVLEVGLVPLRYGHVLDSIGQEVEFLDPWLYLEAAAVRIPHFQLGFGYQLMLPLRADSTVLNQSISLDLLALSRHVRVDTSVFVGFQSPVGDSSTIRRRIITPGFDVALTGQVAEPLALRLGFRNRFVDSRADYYMLDIRAGVVGSLARPDGQALADFAFTFGVAQVVRPEPDMSLDLREPPPEAPPGLPETIDLYTVDLSVTFFFHDAW